MTGRVERQCACLDTRRGGRNDGRETGNTLEQWARSLSVVYGHARSSIAHAYFYGRGKRSNINFIPGILEAKKMIQKYTYPHV